MRLLYSLIVPLVTARVVRHQQQVLIVGEEARDGASQVQPGEDPESVAPSIGVHFTNSYATVAARYQNGSIRDLAKVEGDAEYIELMSRWADLYSHHEW